MGDDRVGTTSVGKSARSLLEAIRSLEREGELLLQKLVERPSDRMRAFARLAATLSRSASPGDLFALLRPDHEPTAPRRATAAAVAGWLGLAAESSLEDVRTQVSELFEQVDRLRERERATAGGISQLHALAQRFDDALAGLARVQGRFAARLARHNTRSDDVERLTQRRDDHITRLIRDVASQRSDMERLVSDIAEDRRRKAEEKADSDPPDRADSERLVAVQRQFEDFRRAQKNAGQGVIDALEALRERLGRLESRAVEMSREARAKTGRIDALARHVSHVEGRLTSAMGTRVTRNVQGPSEQSENAGTVLGQT
jgi:chromosome segregation ATPase